MIADRVRGQHAPSLVDLLVFAPIGLALTAHRRLPCLLDTARQRAGTNVEAARVVGEFAVRLGRQEILKFLRAPGSVIVPTDVVESVAPDERADDSRITSPPESSEHLALPGYDSLAASQVVGRLVSLSTTDLLAIRAYESVTRHRRTVLHRIDELLT